MTKSKNIFKKIKLWTIVLTVLVSSVGLSSAFAANQASVAVRNAQDLIKQAAQAQIVAATFSKCAELIRSNISEESLKNGGWFKVTGATARIINVGPWLENDTQGKVQNGTIFCYQGVVEKFVSTFGLGDIMQLVCDKDSDSGAGGVFRNSGDCNSGVGPYYKMDNASDYIKKIYDEAMQGNTYAKAWGDINTYDSATGYFLYKQDFDTACFDSYVEDDDAATSMTATGGSSITVDTSGKTSVFSQKVSIVNDKGEITTKYVKPKDGSANGTKWGSFAGEERSGEDQKSCDDLISKMNSYAASYQEALFKAIRDECGSQASQEALAAKIAEYEEKAGSNGLSEEETAELNQLREIQSSGNYTQATAGGGLECISTSSFSVVMDDPAVDPTDNGMSAEESCYRHAGSMGWIICPVIFGMQNVADQIYGWVEQFIMIDDSIVGQISQGTSSSSGSIYAAWNTFRTLANIIFVISFLFVIFSQLTGFGIDNYGIKKMLPKLIITAILINLSFIICAIAVDLSNIIGRSINDFLSSLPVAAQINGAEMSTDAEAAAKQVTAYIVDTALVAGTTIGVGTATVILGGWSLIIPILLFLLTFVISVIFAFILLGLRQAAVVVLIVISPLALALYALPNTEKTFKKWFDAFKGVLIVYPIIGAIVGGGNFAGRIMIGASGDFLITMIAGLLFVVPYFLIPTLMRRSLSAIGDIGNRISNLGRNAGTRLSNGINNLEGVKEARADLSERQAQARANRYLNSRRGRRTAEAIRNGEQISHRQARRYTRAMGATRADERARVDAFNAAVADRQLDSRYNNAMDASAFEAAMSDADMEEIDKQTRNYETMITADDYTYIDENGKTQTVRSQEYGDIGKALEHEMVFGDKSEASKAKIRALTNKLISTKEGRAELYAAIDNAQTKAAETKKDISENIKTLSSNIMNNHAGTVKENRRGIYEFAKATATTGTGGNITEYDTRGIESLTASDMANMDDQQRALLVNYASSAEARENGDTAILQRLVNEAIDNNQIQKNQKMLNDFESIKNASLSGDSGSELSHSVWGSMGTPQDRFITGINRKVDDNIAAINRDVADRKISREEGNRRIAEERSRGQRLIQQAHERTQQRNNKP